MKRLSLRKWREPSRAPWAQPPRWFGIKCLVENQLRPREIGRLITFTSTQPVRTGKRGGVYYLGTIRSNGKVIGTGKWYVSCIAPLLVPHGRSGGKDLRYFPTGSTVSKSLGVLSLVAYKVAS
jgi:hypothetical protein